jgi:hypothetical protein
MEGGYLQQTGKDVIFDCGVGSFINGQAGGGMGIEKVADSLIDIFPVDDLFHLWGNINKLPGAGGGNCDLSLCHGDPSE